MKGFKNEFMPVHYYSFNVLTAKECQLYPLHTVFVGGSLPLEA